MIKLRNKFLDSIDGLSSMIEDGYALKVLTMKRMVIIC